MTTAKKEVFIGLQHEHYYLMGDEPLIGGGGGRGCIFSCGGGKEQIFC